METRSSHLSFMLLKDSWFKELYLGVKVAAFSLDEPNDTSKPWRVKCEASHLPQTGSLSLRAAEEWDVSAKTKPFPFCIKPKKANQSSLRKMVGKMLVSIVLERLISEITAILVSNESHPVLDKMVNPDVRDLPERNFHRSLLIERIRPSTKSHTSR